MLRGKGQFWTPDWIADGMVAYVLGGGAHEVFDPAVGEGAFLTAASRWSARAGRSVELSGTELHADVWRAAAQRGLPIDGQARVEQRDFIHDPPHRLFQAIVANPPYIRHHRVSAETKAHLKGLSIRALGRTIDGRAGLHVYFLIQALTMLSEGGRLAFILPADTFEGVYAPAVWSWVLGRYALDAVVTFDASATPFPGVDTNPVVVFLRNAPPLAAATWCRVHSRCLTSLADWASSGCHPTSAPWMTACRRSLAELRSTGLSRPLSDRQPGGAVLGDYARVMRGIATGDNTYFLLTRRQALDLGLSDPWLRPAIARTRDVDADVLTEEHLDDLDRRGRPTRLLCLDRRAVEAFPEAVRAYLANGIVRGLPDRPLIGQRNPWYRMESRQVPPILFAYLGRRNSRFVRNEAGALPLTGFLCVYAHDQDAEGIASLWTAVSHPSTLANLGLVGKSYGSGAIKVEPRALERLPIADAALAAAGLEPRRLDL